MLTIKRFLLLAFFMFISILTYGQVLTGINWVNWAEEPDYANTPYSGRETYTAYRAPADWSVIDDAQSFQSTWEILGEEQNVEKHVWGDDNPLDLENKKFGVQWKAIHDGDIMYVLLRYYDVDALSDPGSFAFEVMAQPKDIIRHESTYQAGVDMDDIAQRNMAYGRYIELGGGKALYKDGDVDEYTAISGLSGNWMYNENAFLAFLDLNEMMFWHEQDGEIMAVLPMDFAGVLSYPDDPENIEGERTALQVGETIAFDIRTQAKMNDENLNYQWSGNHNNAYASNYYSGHVTIADQDLADPEPYTLTLLKNDEAMGSIIQGDGVHNEWSSVVIKAEANPEYEFVSWTDEQDNEVGSLSTLEYTMPSRDVTLTANFREEPDYYSLDVFSQPTEGGNVLGSGMYEAEETVSVNASPQSGYSFVQWTDYHSNHVSHVPDFNYTMSAKPDTLVAHFEEVEITDPPFTGINWVNWAEEPDYANTPYSGRETYTVYRAPSDWSVIDDAQSFQSTWETLGEEQNVVKHVRGADNPLDLENKKFGVQWKAIHDGDIMYVLLRYYDVDALSDPGSFAFEIMAQPKDIIRHESTFQAGVDMDDIAQRNMAYGRYIELGGGMAIYEDGAVSQYSATSGLSGNWWNNEYASRSFIDLSNMMFWHEHDGEIMAVLPMDFAGVLSYPDDPEDQFGKRTALQVGETIAFDVRSQAKMNDEFISYQWSGNHNNAYASNYYSGHVTISNLDLVEAGEIDEEGIQIKTNSDGEGYVKGGGFYSPGDTVQLSVRPFHDKSRFVGWNENYTLLEETKDTIVFEARESREIVALFKSSSTGGDITLTDDDHPDIIIFPNPAKNEVTVKSREWIDFVSVMDINGKMILNEPVNGRETRFGVQSLQPGIYLIQIKTQSDVHVRKLQVAE